MSSMEPPDGHEPPPQRFSEWLLHITALFAAIIALTMIAIHFSGRPTPAEQAADQKHMVEMVCAGLLLGPPHYSAELCKDQTKRGQ